MEDTWSCVAEYKIQLQRVTKGYCDKDLWNIDYWFMNLMPDMLQQFKDTKHGSPSCLGTEYVDEHGISCNDECHAEWDKILDKMIFLFREMNEEMCQKKKYISEKSMRGVLQEFGSKIWNLWTKLEEEKKK